MSNSLESILLGALVFVNVIPTPSAGIIPSATSRLAVVSSAPDAGTTLHSENPYEIRINTRTPMLKLYKNKTLYRTYKVALGKPETPTPVGDWKIVDKQKNWGGGFGTRWLGLNVSWGTYGIHGTNRPESIGHYVSNGCIRMHNSDVEQLYKLVPLGTRVVISGNPLKNLRNLTLGNIGADVLLVQHRLQDEGFFTGQCDGRFKGDTQFSLSLYELAHHLPMDGMVGRDDYIALGLLRAPNGSSSSSRTHLAPVPVLVGPQ